MDVFVVLGLLLLVTCVVVLFLGLCYFLACVTTSDGDLNDWIRSENSSPERIPAPIDPLVFKTLQGINQLSQQRYSGFQRAEPPNVN
jgi:hypothetical protein